MLRYVLKLEKACRVKSSKTCMLVACLCLQLRAVNFPLSVSVLPGYVEVWLDTSWKSEEAFSLLSKEPGSMRYKAVSHRTALEVNVWHCTGSLTSLM